MAEKNGGQPATDQNVTNEATADSPATQTAPAATAGKKPTAKSKAARGLDASIIASWLPVDFNTTDNETIKRVAAARTAVARKADPKAPQVKVQDVLLGVIRPAFTAEVMDAFRAEAATAPEKTTTPSLEDLPADPTARAAAINKVAASAEKRAARAATAMENATKALAAARALAAGAPVAAADNKSDGTVA